jgi:hypothetical protein
VLDGVDRVLGLELVAQRQETRRELAQAVQLARFERQVLTAQELVKPPRERPDPQVLDPVLEMGTDVLDLADLQLGVKRECSEPDLRRVARQRDGVAGVRGQEPGAVGVVGEDADDAVRPARGELDREAGLERLDRGAGLEPSLAVGERHSDDRRP